MPAATPRSLRLAHRDFGQRLRDGDSYGILLVLIVISYVLMAWLESSEWSRAVLAAAFGSTLVLALHTSQVRGRWMRAAIVLVGVAVAVNIVQAFAGEAFHGSGYLVMVVLVVAAPLVVLNRIFRHPVVNVETILGAICAYMLIAIAFAAAYGAMNQIEGQFFAQGPDHDPVHFLYFSFAVITTLGFGDLTPHTDGGRVLVSIEAVIGQIFLVTLVASLVGSYGRQRAAVPARDDRPSVPDE